MRIGLLSDSHGLLDDAIFKYFEGCDEVWHAGDFGDKQILDRLRAFKPTRGVFGNIDGEALRAELTEDLEWDCQGLRVYMTHIGGYPGRWDARARRELKRRRPGLFVCGHSHVLRVMRDVSLGLVYLNPGACGHKGWHTMRTALRFSIIDGQAGGVEAIELGPRGRQPRSGPPSGD